MSTTPTPTALHELDLDITGMTCASCVARVEKKLNKLDGVDAVVNLATERAHVTMTDPVPVEDLIAAVDKAGYGAALHEAPGGHGTDQDGGTVEHDTSAPVEGRIADLRRRLIVALVLGIPVMALSMINALQVPGWQWLVAALTLPIAVWCAWPFHRSAAKAARHGSSTMDTLVSMGVIAATGWSLWALLLGGAGSIGYTMDMSLWPAADSGAGHTGAHAAPHLYFETTAMIVSFLLLGRFLEARSRHRAGDALRGLMELGAKDVALLTPQRPVAGGEDHAEQGDTRYAEERVPVERLTVGSLFRVRPGEKIATDGVVVEGTAAIDTSVVTGESLPVDAAPGDAVTGATVATDGTIVVRATRVGTETTLAQIAKLVADAQTGKAPVQRLADRISAVFVPVVIGIAVLTLIGWLVAGHGAQAAFTAAVSVLVIACPCALGLATPTALLVGTGRAAKLGIIIKGPEILESTRRIDTVVLDKTGTVTEGRMTLTDVALLDGDAASTDPRDGAGRDAGLDALVLAAAVEAGSEHPVARAIVAAATERMPEGTHLPRSRDFANHAGRGVSATLTLPDGATEARARVGRPSWLAEEGVDTAALDAAAAHVTRAEERGDTAVALAVDGRAVAVLAVRDALRASSAQAIRELRELDVTPHLLTGDNERAARRVAAEIGIPEQDVTAGVLPADKATTVRALQDAGHVVAMVGDGVNDAAALAQADLGLAMGTGTDVAIDAGDLTLVRSDLAAVPVAIRVSRATLRIIKQNLTWAFGYNVVAIPLAIAGLVNPGLAAAFMAASSVIVVTNSLRLRSAG